MFAAYSIRGQGLFSIIPLPHYDKRMDCPPSSLEHIDIFEDLVCGVWPQTSCRDKKKKGLTLTNKKLNVQYYFMVINRRGGNFAILKLDHQKLQKIYRTKLSFTYIIIRIVTGEILP